MSNSRIIPIIDFAQEQEVFRAHGITRDGSNGEVPAREQYQQQRTGHHGDIADERREALEFDLLRYVMEGGE